MPSRSVTRRLVLRLTLISTVLLVGLVASAPTAGAHAFLVRTDPPQGARLAGAPRQVALQFSSPMLAHGASVSVYVGTDKRPLDVSLEYQDRGRVLRATLAQSPRGIYVVHWHVVAEDTHESDGEFAFAVGPVTGAIPGAQHRATGSSPVGAALSWLFFVGLAMASGGLMTGLLVDPAVGVRAAGVRAGLLVAAVASLIAVIQARASGATQGLARATAADTVAVLLLCLAMTLTAWTRRRALVLAMVVGAAIAWSAKGHGATAGGLLGWAIDATHLLAAAVWVGALAHLVLRLRRAQGGGAGAALVVAKAYARLALLLVFVLAGAGGLSAWRLVPTWADLLSSGYGRLILTKTVLFAIAVGLALVSRVRGLAGARLRTLQRATPIEAVVVALVLAFSAVLVTTAPPAPAQAAATLLGPPPLAGPADRDAGLAGALTVAVAAGDGQLEVEILPPGGPPIAARAAIEAQLPDGHGVTLFARPCGPGCFSQRFDLPPGTTRLSVIASARGWVGGTFATDLVGAPPPSDRQLLVDLLATMQAVPAVTVTEQTSSGPESTTRPDQFSLSGPQFIATEPYAGGDASDIQPLAPGNPGLRMYIAGDRIWVTLWLDPRGRIVREREVDVSHDIERTFAYPG